MAVLAGTLVFPQVVFLQLRQRFSLKVLWWVNLGRLLEAPPAAVLLPLLYRTGWDHMTGKLVVRDKDRDMTCQSLLLAKQTQREENWLNFLPVKIDLDGGKQLTKARTPSPHFPFFPGSSSLHPSWLPHLLPATPEQRRWTGMVGYSQSITLRLCHSFLLTAFPDPAWVVPTGCTPSWPAPL